MYTSLLISEPEVNIWFGFLWVKRESEGFLHEETSEPESLVLHDMQCEKLTVSVNSEEVLEDLLRPFRKS